MKLSRTISLILALCMVMSVFAIGMVTTSAAEDESAIAEVAADEGETDDTGAGEEETTDKERWEPLSGHSDLSSDELTLFYQATGELADKCKKLYTFYPVKVLAWNVNSNYTTYVYLCCCLRSTDTINAMRKLLGPNITNYLKYECFWWEVFTINLSENYSPHVSFYQIDIDNVKTLESVPENHKGIYLVRDPGEDLLNDLTPAVKDALSGYDELTLRAIELLGKQELSTGTNYRFLSFGTTNDLVSKSGLYLVDICEEDNKADIVNIAVFDIDEYSVIPNSNTDNTTETIEPSENEISETQDNTQETEKADVDSQNPTTSNSSASSTTTGSNSSNSSSTSTGSNSSNSSSTSTGSSASATSPKTGQEDTIVFVMLGVMILASAVIFYVRKRERT